MSDSFYPTPPMSLVWQLCCLLRTNEKNLEVHMMDMQTQSGLNDCGCFAIACATALCYGQNPSRIHWTQSKMRQHLATCLTKSKLTPSPSRRSARSVSADIKQTLTFPVFCKCRMLEDRRECCVASSAWSGTTRNAATSHGLHLKPLCGCVGSVFKRHHEGHSTTHMHRCTQC